MTGVRLSRRQRREAWHVDHVNNAPDAATAMNRAWDWAQAELRRLADVRPEDADAFRWHLVQLLAQLAHAVPRNHPPEPFRNLKPGQRPQITGGGGWTPVRDHGPHPQARQP